MGEKLANAPVFLTAAQVKFNPILSFEDYAPALQEKFRKIGFPDYKARVQAGFEINISAPSAVKVSPQETRQHSFLNRDGSACFVIENSRIYFQVTEYNVFETFRDQFIQGLELVHAMVSLDFVDGVSMRLLDAIVPPAEESLSDFLVQELLGIGEALNQDTWAINHSATEASIKTPEHTIVIRTLMRYGKISVPPDLNIAGLNLNPRFLAVEGVHAVLDTDCIFSQREGYDASLIAARLRLLKDDLRTIFESAVKAHAIEFWS
jgi:uncharacterized protein (TIGR04255 family)